MRPAHAIQATLAVAVAPEGDDLGVVHEAADHGRGDEVVAEDLAPALLAAARTELGDAVECDLVPWSGDMDGSSAAGGLRLTRDLPCKILTRFPFWVPLTSHHDRTQRVTAHDRPLAARRLTSTNVHGASPLTP
jgi:hypothetical protein